MASNYLFMTGWEMGSAAICDMVISDAPVTTAQKRTGAYSLNLTDAADGIAVTLPSSYTTLYAGVAYRTTAAGGGTCVGSVSVLEYWTE